MMTFEKWLIENHPEIIEEGKISNALGALAITGASLFGGSDSSAAEFKPAVNVQQVDQNLDYKRTEAMQKESDGSAFKKNWGKDFTKDKEREAFKIILMAKTVKDHDDFSKKLQNDMKEIIRVQLLGNSNPKDWRYEFDKQRVIKSYDYQFLRYLQQLIIASKNVLIQNR